MSGDDRQNSPSISRQNRPSATTGISLFMTIIIGIPGGYMIGTFLEKAGMSTGFVFPTRAFLLFVTVMLLLEVLMTILLIHSWKKQSVIEIMRN